MNIVYQIIAKDTKAYAKDIASCDAVCAILIGNGVIPTVRRIPKNKVPMSDLELVAEL